MKYSSLIERMNSGARMPRSNTGSTTCQLYNPGQTIMSWPQFPYLWNRITFVSGRGIIGLLYIKHLQQCLTHNKQYVGILFTIAVVIWNYSTVWCMYQHKALRIK